MSDRDHNICTAAKHGQHGPIEANYDPEIANSHVSVVCGACGITTGYAIENFVNDLEWN